MSAFHLDRYLSAQRDFPVWKVWELLTYLPSSGELIWNRRENENFNSRYAGTVAGAEHRSGAIQIQLTHDGRSRLFWAHRIAWAHYYGDWPETLIDHLDGNPRNNRIANLRHANGSENGANKHELRGSVPFKGVYRFKDGRYAAQIKYAGSWVWLGLHDDAVAAAKRYDVAAVDLHGDFAVTNSMMGLYRKFEIEALA